MGSIVAELVRAATDEHTRTSVLLRKALVVARKLRVKDFEEWIGHELDGYPEGATYPAYRKVRGRVMYHNPYHGLQPVIFRDTKQERSFAIRPARDTVAQIEAMLDGDKHKSEFMMTFPAAVGANMMDAAGTPSPPVLVFAPSQLEGILDSARNIVLRWALKLEDDGIVGEGLSFTEAERQVAAATPYTVNNFYGDATGVQIQQATTNSTQALTFEGVDIGQVQALIEAVRSTKRDLGLTEEQGKELDAEVVTLEAQVRSPKPKHVVLRAGLRSVQAILENAAGTAAATAIMHKFATLFGSGGG
ncbi:MAG TPA: hypothetical protein VLT84_11855 [Acidobacteriota bacterium]|nr:hypothetical protein [Acidobacteriota bacterium]